MSEPYPLDFDELRAHCVRAHAMSCSDPTDPSRRTPWADTLRVLDEADRRERVAAARALREAADAYLAEFGTWGGASQGAWLRERAAEIETTP